jgi:hypothetical protein
MFNPNLVLNVSFFGKHHALLNLMIIKSGRHTHKRRSRYVWRDAAAVLDELTTWINRQNGPSTLVKRSTSSLYFCLDQFSPRSILF